MISDHAMVRLSDYPILEELGQRRTKAKRLDRRACRYIYQTGLSEIDPARIGAAERQLITELGISWRIRDDALMRRMAGKYIWWKTPDEALERPERVIAQVMDIGDYEDVQALAEHVGDDALRDVLTHAEAGWFNERS
ncbi:hypothetical protein [Methylocaldum sp. RMAD-M]|jgi:hypothetical protein|uniref:hypothetical protein n=1 Tax=unclassified Methylocaldum TaxID=2622260 RepID=UPI00197B7273|nr:hypothetical protein [Methylocaldum sp. RMAD-M]MBP1153135.1 hypothetical protein [Methylocaldum sp. RMAD-M]